MDKRAIFLVFLGLCAGAGLAVGFLRRSEGRAEQLTGCAPPHFTWPPPRFAERLDVSTFQKGNIHAHSTLSDGDSPPQDIFLWYRNHGYAFIALTDHNRLVDLERFRILERPGFTLITGEELTMWSKGVPVHINAICTKSTIGGGNFPTAGEALRWAVDKVRAQGGTALVNHPNFEWALTAKDFPDARGAQLLEIWSGHPFVRTNGDLTHKSHEALWDESLTNGDSFAGVAVDDMHHLDPTVPESGASRPGRGFIEVFALEATEPAICDALKQGRLYASSGAKLRRIQVEDGVMSVWPDATGSTVDFVGEGGVVLDTARPGEGAAATYQLRGEERYVRARVNQPDGKRAWTQAYRVAR